MDFVRHTPSEISGPRFALIGGTPGDARLGRELIEQTGASCESFCLSETPAEQHRSQHIEPLQLEDRLSSLIHRINLDDYARIVIFCNSLSTAVDLRKLERESSVPVFSPLAIYRRLPSLYSRVLVIAANGQALAGIERELISIGPRISVFGIAMLALVEAIEDDTPADQLVVRFGIQNIIDLASTLRCQAIVLACTHFTWIAPRVAALSRLSVIDTAQALISAAAES